MRLGGLEVLVGMRLGRAWRSGHETRGNGGLA